MGALRHRRYHAASCGCCQAAQAQHVIDDSLLSRKGGTFHPGMSLPLKAISFANLMYLDPVARNRIPTLLIYRPPLLLALQNQNVAASK